MKKFKKIPQFKDVYHAEQRRQQYEGKDCEGRPIYNESSKLKGTDVFVGTEKLHGTNSGLAFTSSTQELVPQKRTASITSGHFGFADWVNIHNKELKELLSAWCDASNNDHAVFFGEWVGQGIQNKVAIAQLSKRFVLFAIWIPRPTEDDSDDGFYVHEDFVKGVSNSTIDFYNIYQYDRWEVTVDWSNPQEAHDKIVGYTLAVEDESPFAKSFGVSGIGEGIVWQSEDKEKSYWFKTTGSKHSAGGGGKKMPTLSPIVAHNIKEFVDKVVTPDRLLQGYGLIKEENGIVEKRHIPQFLSWIVKDIQDEEGDAYAGLEVDYSKINKAISTQARNWFLVEVDKF